MRDGRLAPRRAVQRDPERPLPRGARLPHRAAAPAQALRRAARVRPRRRARADILVVSAHGMRLTCTGRADRAARGGRAPVQREEHHAHRARSLSHGTNSIPNPAPPLPTPHAQQHLLIRRTFFSPLVPHYVRTSFEKAKEN
ncbi:hypothetical protein A0H81_11035 [Grifola frondosa]|uniref:Uncharacterized protein n=1 Tax=Grifola frondosa TaxID=5627 RepID=A0A1C7LXM4_GRIFR|nr:hypothetical protein A0H81_11035 [Grifola frondosa]